MDSVSFLTDPSCLSTVQLNHIGYVEESQDSKIKPRRRLGDSKEDESIAPLISKTRAINLENVEEKGLGVDQGQWVQSLYSTDCGQNYWAVKKIRKYVCGAACPVLAILASAATAKDVPGRVLSGKLDPGPTGHTTAIVEADVLQLLNQLLKHPSGNIRTQAAWTIGNIVGDREGYRDVVLQNCSITAILEIWQGEFIDENARKEAFRISMWVVDNMCRYRPDWHLMQPVLEAIPNFVNHDDPLLLKECCWAIARILHSAGRNPLIDRIITPQLCSRLVQILSRNNMMTTHPILRGMINLSSSKNSAHLEYIISAGILSEIDLILTYHKIPSSCRPSLEIFSLQILSNLSAHFNFAALILETSLTSHIMKILEDHPDQDLQREACLFVRNCMSFRDTYLTKILVENNAVILLLQYLNLVQRDEKAELLAVDALLNILIVGDYTSSNEYLQIANSYAGFEIYLKIYLNSTGKQIEDMDQELDEPNVFSDEEDSELSSLASVKQKLAAKTKLVMRTWYLKEFQDTIASAQSSDDVLQSLGRLTMNSSNQKNAILDLINEFSALTPKDSQGTKVSTNRSESEVTLA